jgi:hypothetical protein
MYIEMYLKACQIDINTGGAVVKHSKSPKSYSDFLVKYLFYTFVFISGFI